jgi:hypothetical protein
VELGADAIVVSNHGGRVLDTAVSPWKCWPIRAGRLPALPLLMDSGVRQGTDVLKAIALGANAVLLGRPQMHALAVAGMLGTAHMLYLLRAELELAMAQTGCAQLGRSAPTCGSRVVPIVRCASPPVSTRPASDRWRPGPATVRCPAARAAYHPLPWPCLAGCRT